MAQTPQTAEQRLTEAFELIDSSGTRAWAKSQKDTFLRFESAWKALDRERLATWIVCLAIGA